jgi:hypothetical protein
MKPIALLAGLWMAVAASVAQAQDATPAELESWTAEAEAFRISLRDMAQLWARDGAALRDLRTDIFKSEAETFTSATEAMARTLRTRAVRDETARALEDLARNISEGIAYLDEARAQNERAVIQVFMQLDQVVREGFGEAGDERAESASLVQIGYTQDQAQDRAATRLENRRRAR